MTASRKQFACANPEKSEKTRSRLQQIMAQEDSKLEFNRHKSHGVPNSLLVSLCASEIKKDNSKMVIVKNRET